MVWVYSDHAQTKNNHLYMLKNGNNTVKVSMCDLPTMNSAFAGLMVLGSVHLGEAYYAGRLGLFLRWPH
jgi:hypothetical protein